MLFQLSDANPGDLHFVRVQFARIGRFGRFGQGLPRRNQFRFQCCDALLQIFTRLQQQGTGGRSHLADIGFVLLSIVVDDAVVLQVDGRLVQTIAPGTDIIGQTEQFSGNGFAFLARFVGRGLQIMDTGPQSRGETDTLFLQTDQLRAQSGQFVLQTLDLGSGGFGDGFRTGFDDFQFVLGLGALLVGALHHASQCLNASGGPDDHLGEIADHVAAGPEAVDGLGVVGLPDREGSLLGWQPDGFQALSVQLHRLSAHFVQGADQGIEFIAHDWRLGEGAVASQLLHEGFHDTSGELHLVQGIVGVNLALGLQAAAQEGGFQFQRGAHQIADVGQRVHHEFALLFQFAPGCGQFGRKLLGISGCRMLLRHGGSSCLWIIP